MMKKTRSVQRMLAYGFGLALALLLALGGTSLWEFGQNEKNITMITTSDIPIALTLEEITIQLLEQRRNEKDFLLNIGNPAKQEDYLKKFGEVAERMQKNIAAINEKLDQDEDISQETRQNAKKMSILAQTYQDNFLAITEQINNTPDITPQQGNKLLGNLKKTIHELEEIIKSSKKEASAMIKTTADDTIHGINEIRLILQISVLASIILLISVALLVSRRINKPLQEAVTLITNSTEHLHNAARELTTGSQRLAEGASEQAASVEETSASMAEISAQVKQNADNSSQADRIMKETSMIVNEAQQAMGELSDSMAEISKASEETFKIVKTIDDISFQTNLLALNAAVEAARAGEAGAGFAVVADEVRNLAMRAAEASKNTAAMIEKTVDKIKSGVQLVDHTSEKFTGVTESTAKVATLMSEIDVASNEQSNGVEQVSTTMQEMSSVTQTIAANAEESAGVAEEMDGQTKNLLHATDELAGLAGIDGKSRARSAKASRSATTAPTAARATLKKPVPQLTAARIPVKPAPTRSAAQKPSDIIPFGDDDDGDFEDF